MTRKFEKVPVRGMTAEEVLALWQEGKLYQEVAMPAATKKMMLLRCQQEALVYVSAINDYVAPEWQASINKVWQAIVSEKLFNSALVIQRGKAKGSLNRYVVTNLVCWLHNKGVFRRDVTMQTLHLCMEKITKRNKYYMSCGNYAMSDAARKFLKQLLESIK